jgi:hypothetical protein
MPTRNCKSRNFLKKLGTFVFKFYPAVSVKLPSRWRQSTQPLASNYPSLASKYPTARVKIPTH